MVIFYSTFIAKSNSKIVCVVCRGHIGKLGSCELSVLVERVMRRGLGFAEDLDDVYLFWTSFICLRSYKNSFLLRVGKKEEEKSMVVIVLLMQRWSFNYHPLVVMSNPFYPLRRERWDYEGFSIVFL